MSLTARQLREERKRRIAARRARVHGEEGDMPDWLEEKIESAEEPVDPSLAADEPSDPSEPAEPSTADDFPETPAVLSAEEPSEPSEPAAAEEPVDPSDEPSLAADDLDKPGEVKSAFMYNPLYQKPVALGPRGYKSGYHYFGPPPDAGTTYGYYMDADSKVGIITPATKAKVFSPVTGQPMKYMGKVETEGLATVLAVSDQMVRFKVGKDTRVTSAPLLSIQSPKVFDALTGADITDDIGKIKSEDEPSELDPSMAQDEPSDLLEPSMAQDEPSDLLEPAAADLPGQTPVKVEEPAMPLQGADEPSEPVEPSKAEEVQVVPPVEPSKAEDEPSEPSEVESVQYEALQSADSLAEAISEADVHMTLFDEETKPYWNLDVKGMPVARVYLKDQPKPDEIREVFCSADYYRGVSGAIEKVGLKPVLKQLNAKLWANEVEKTKLATDIRAEVEATAKEKVTALTKNLMRDLMNRIAIVCAGMDKNFYRDAGNPLKESIWSELHSFGITNPSPIIEAAFRRGATRYFETVLSKAVDYMEMKPEALEQIKAAIGDMDVLPAGDGTVGDELPEAIPSPEQAPTLSQRLAASSVAIAGVPTVVGSGLGDHKQALRHELRFGGAGPRVRK